MTRHSFLRFVAAYLVVLSLALIVFQPPVATQATMALLGMAREDDPHTSRDRGLPIFGVRVAACGTALSGSANDYNLLQFDANGNLCTNIATNSAGSATDSEDGTVAPTQSNVALTLNFPYLFDGANWVRNSGLSLFRSIDLDETEEEIKASAGQIFSVWFTNTATTTRFLKCYNATAANVTVGTTTPVLTLGLPGNASDDITGQLGTGAHGWAFTTAITCAATTGIADADTGAPGANEVTVNIGYK